jgi:23S rRNA (cytosine1962-C5)-methyltransferase
VAEIPPFHTSDPKRTKNGRRRSSRVRDTQAAPKRTPAARADVGGVLRLAAGREKSLHQRHPWLFSGAIARVDGDPRAGDTVLIASADGEPLALGAYSPASKIRARVWTFDADATIDAAFVGERFASAAASRAPMLDARHTGCRLVHAEADRLPGVVVDRYGDVAVVQLTSAGAERWRDAIVDAAASLPGIASVYERSDADVRALEGLAARSGIARGTLPDAVELIEDGLVYTVDVGGGQKTGFYLDQRDNRARVRALAAGRDTLNVFCYTGGFTLSALAGGAPHVVSIDSSADALERARANVARNRSLPADGAEWRCADAFAELRRLRDANASFDLVVLDPPKFAPTAAHAERAARAYKDINLCALRLLRRGGLLATFSCSGGVDATLFRKIVAGAAADAGVEATIVARFAASADHPVALAFPEGEYLKGLLLRKR